MSTFRYQLQITFLDIETLQAMDNPGNNRQRGGDFPEPAKEQDKCREFLTNFISNNTRKYYEQLVCNLSNRTSFFLLLIIFLCIQQEIANRQRAVLKIELDDIINVSGYRIIEQHTLNVYFILYSSTMTKSLLPIFKTILLVMFDISKKLSTSCYLLQLLTVRKVETYSIFFR